MVDSLSLAFQELLEPGSLLIFLVAVGIGWIVGVLPGIGAITALTIAMPFTFGWDPMQAMFLLLGIYGATSFAGSITAILLNTPGEPVNAATVFDGFPMTQQGQGGRAIGMAASSELFGGLLAVIVLIALLPVVRSVVMFFGPPEIFWLMMLSLATISWTSGKNLFKGWAAGGIGILVSMVGFSYVHANVKRFMGGSTYLWDGIELVPFLIGLMAIGAVMEYSMGTGYISKEKVNMNFRQAWGGFIEIFRHKICFIRSTVVGLIVGIMPGIGATTSTFLGYTMAVQSSRHAETFGKGEPEGIIASESAVGATTPGDLVPTLGFGIPGSSVMAIIMGAAVLHGIAPGPLLLRDHMNLAWAIIIGLVVSKILASVFGVLAAPLLARISRIKITFLTPWILVLCACGAYSISENLLDVALALITGIFAYAMIRFKFPVICLVMGYILGTLAEHHFWESLQISLGDPAIFFRPVSIILCFMFLVVLTIPFIKLYRDARRRRPIARPIT